MKFYSAYDKPPKTPCDSGSPYKTIYKRSVDENGMPCLEESGKENIYQKIQLCAKGNLVSDLIDRAKRGDPNAIPEPIESFVDCTKLPKNLLEARNQLVRAESYFNELPVDVRNKYGNNFANFLSAIDSGTFVKETVIKAREAAELEKFRADQKASSPPLSTDQINYIKTQLGGNQ